MQICLSLCDESFIEIFDQFVSTPYTNLLKIVGRKLLVVWIIVQVGAEVDDHDSNQELESLNTLS